jgi:hypothetical protein
MSVPVYGRTSGGRSGGGPPVYGAGAGRRAAPTKKKHKGGLFHDLGIAVSPVTHLGRDVGQFALGFGPGSYKAGKAVGLDIAQVAPHNLRQLGEDVLTGGVTAGIRAAHHPPKHTYKDVLVPIGKSYEQTYGPLTHGDVSTFLHTFYEHPLGPVLDVATVLTAGAGGVARVGKVAAEVGAISKTSKLARLGEPGTIELRGPAALAKAGKLRAAGAEGELPESLLRPTSRRPAIRARQVALDRALKLFPAETRMVGELARFGRELPRAARQEKLRLSLAVKDYNRAAARLKPKEIVAFHLIGRAVPPAEYARLLEREASRGRHVEPQTLALIDDPELQQLFERPTPRIERALAAGRQLSAIDTELKIRRGWLTKETAAEAPYRHARILSGARFEETPARTARVGAVEPQAARAGLVGGKSAQEIAAELEAAGRPQPFHIPDVAVADTRRGVAGFFKSSGAGRGVVQKPVHQSKGVLFQMGRLALGKETLSRKFLHTVQKAYADDLHNALLSEAVRVPQGAPLPEGWTYLRRLVGKTPERIPHTEKTLGQFRREMSDFVVDPRVGDLSQAAEHLGYRLAVPERFVKQVVGEFSRSNSVVRAWVEKPFTIWRALILAVPPRFLVNNVVGNHLLYAIRFAGYNGLRGYLDAVRREHGAGMVRRLIEDRAVPEPLYHRLMADYFPEQVQGTFGVTQTQGLGKLGGAVARGKVLSRGVIPATQAIAEGQVRRAAVLAGLRSSPEVRAILKTMPRQTRDFETAARQALERNPQLAREVSEKVNDALGDYLSLSAFERDNVRQLVPFYSWYKAISRISLKLALDAPGRALLLTKIGQIGEEWVKRELGRNAPAWLLSFIPFAKSGGKYRKGVSTSGANPFQTLASLGEAGAGLVTGKGSEAKFQVAGVLNPFIGGALSLREQQGGGLIGGTVGGVYAGLPETRLYQALAGQGVYSRQAQRLGKPYFKKNTRTELLAMLGYPEKQLNLSRIRSAPVSRGSARPRGGGGLPIYGR